MQALPFVSASRSFASRLFLPKGGSRSTPSARHTFSPRCLYPDVLISELPNPEVSQTQLRCHRFLETFPAPDPRSSGLTKARNALSFWFCHGSHLSPFINTKLQLLVATAQTMPTPSDLKQQFSSIVHDSLGQRFGQGTGGTACVCSVMSEASAAQTGGSLLLTLHGSSGHTVPTRK